MILRVRQLFASLYCLLAGPTVIFAQGTIQFGFENFQIKDLPPFVTGIASVENSDSSMFAALRVPAFEGEKFLAAYVGTTIRSPDGNLIQSFDMQIFLPKTGLANDSWRLFLGNDSWFVGNGGSWLAFHGTFESPTESVLIRAFSTIESNPSTIGIDAVQFTTIPEPQTFWLLTLGLGAILLRRSKSLETQSR